MATYPPRLKWVRLAPAAEPTLRRPPPPPALLRCFVAAVAVTVAVLLRLCSAALASSAVSLHDLGLGPRI